MRCVPRSILSLSTNQSTSLPTASRMPRSNLGQLKYSSWKNEVMIEKTFFQFQSDCQQLYNCSQLLAGWCWLSVSLCETSQKFLLGRWPYRLLRQTFHIPFIILTEHGHRLYPELLMSDTTLTHRALRFYNIRIRCSTWSKISEVPINVFSCTIYVLIISRRLALHSFEPSFHHDSQMDSDLLPISFVVV